MDPSTPSASTPIEAPSSSPTRPDIFSSALLVEPSSESTSTIDHSEAPSAEKTTTSEESPSSEPRHCWICLQDEGVDSPASSTWRSPCPCNLQAHEECLLEWISDIQSPTNVNSAGGYNSKILCPQCKAEIKVDKPVELALAVEELFTLVGRQLLLPAGGMMFLGILYSGSMVYGFNAIESVLGADEARRMLISERTAPSTLMREWGLGPVIDVLQPISHRALDPVKHFARLASPFFPAGVDSWLFIAAPWVAPTLLLARTGLGDHLFSAVPIIYCMFPGNHILPSWPPSSGMAFAFLPIVRSAYNEVYSYLFSEHEKRWALAVQRKPRDGETAEEVAANHEHRAQEEGNILGIEIEIVDVEDQPAGAQARNLPPQEAAPPAAEGQDLPVQPEEVAAGQVPGAAPQQAADAANAQPQPQPQAEGWEFRRNISTFSVARTIIATLYFPAASSLMGHLLYKSLPTSWVEKPAASLLKAPGLGASAPRATGLLQEKWGRSIVGGAALIVLKDAVKLYCMWRRAKTESMRRVLDYDRKKEKRERKKRGDGERERAA